MSESQHDADAARQQAHQELAQVRARGEHIRDWADYWRKIRDENHFIEKLDRALKGRP